MNEKDESWMIERMNKWKKTINRWMGNELMNERIDW